MQQTFFNSNHWITVEMPYTLEYILLFSKNDLFEEYELWEYGIQCNLYDSKKNLISTEKVTHISPNQAYVKDLLTTLLSHKVFPIHLNDVISDYIVASN